MRITLFLMTFLSLPLMHSQDSEKKVAVGIYTGISDYYGELNTQFFNINNTYRGQIGGTLFYYLNPFFNVGMDMGFGDHGFFVLQNKYRASIWKGNISARFKFNNGIIMPENHDIQPYISLGTGFANTFVDLEGTNVPGLDWTLNAGLGFNYKINDWLKFNYNLNYAMTNHDKRDHISLGKINDQFILHTIGIVVPISPIIDTDEDGIVDRKDRCPNTPFGVEVDMLGCPYDSDGDGVADYQDNCINEIGLPSMRGCPDNDDDGIANIEDKCPDLAGPMSAYGCPDGDLDGVSDDIDGCPDVFGPKETKGCPDKDMDGILDEDDACPELAGTEAMKGCPDTDGDGINDLEDRCPKTAGVASNQGCPEIKEETKKVFERALTGIQFETGKAKILRSSNGILNNVASIMKENPTYQLDINGHTDDQGDDEQNRLLSQARAEAVKNYLIAKGIDTNRMEAKGYGEDQPKTTNDTAAGRAINRRVVFVVRFLN